MNIVSNAILPSQGLLKIWTGHSNWFLLNPKPFEIASQKFQHCYNLERNEFSPNLKNVAQNLDLPRPFEVLDVFGGKSKSEAPRPIKICTKRVPIKVNNWWKFGLDISNHFWEIKNLRFFFFQVSPTMYKNNFQKLFLFIVGDTWKTKKN